MYYRGWYGYESTVKGWVGLQHGVEVCSRTHEGLHRVINHHIADRAAWFAARSAS
jgi:hypothetical protein